MKRDKKQNGPENDLAKEPSVKQTGGDAKAILLMSAWFGLVAGLIEGVTLLVFHQNGWLPWRLYNRAISLETLWIAPLFDLLLFGLVGLVMGLLARRFPWRPIYRATLQVFVFLTLFDWLVIALSGRLAILAILVLALGVSVQLARWLYQHRKAVDRLVRRTLPGLAILALLALVGIQGGFYLQEKAATARLPAASTETPNVLVIVADALRADHLSSYGYARPTSPNIDRLAQQGVLFENAISASSWTQPSHASMLTGRYTYEHKAELNPLDSRYPTLGEAAQARGYRTGAFSANTLFFTRRQGFGRGFIHFEDNFYSLADMAANTLYGYLFDEYVLRQILHYEAPIARKLAADVNAASLRWIDADPGKPFFVVLNYFDVHDPYTPPQPYRSKFSNLENPGGLVNGFVGRYFPQLTPGQLQSEVDAYDGGVAYVDEQVNQLLTELSRRGLLENTLVVFTSDHGESFGEHGLMQHSGSLYLEEIHVPLIFWWPGHLPAGKQVEIPVSTTALPATIMDLIGAKEVATFPGPPLTRLFGSETDLPVWPNPLSELAEFMEEPPQNPAAHGALKSLISRDWHYIASEAGGEELYAWRADPRETVNRAGDQVVHSIVQDFRALLERYLASARPLWEGSE